MKNLLIPFIISTLLIIYTTISFADPGCLYPSNNSTQHTRIYVKSGSSVSAPNGGAMYWFMPTGKDSGFCYTSIEYLTRERALLYHYALTQKNPTQFFTDIKHMALTGIAGWGIPAILGITNPAATIGVGFVTCVIDYGITNADIISFESAFNKSGKKGVDIVMYYNSNPSAGSLGWNTYYEPWKSGTATCPKGFNAYFDKF